MKNPTRIAAALFAVALSPMALASAPVVNQALSEAEVLAGQQAWCKALVDISATHKREGQAAAKALESGREILLPHLPSYERRIIHLYLQTRTDVTTYSEGEAEDRRLVVRPTTPEAE